MLEARKLGIAQWILPLLALSTVASRSSRADAPDSSGQQTQQSVARALHLGSEGGRSLQVLRGPLPASAQLHVVSVESVPGRPGSLARLACQSSSDCLPFYVIVGGAPLPPLANILIGKSPAPRREPPLAHPGDRVEIVEQLSGMNLHTRGVCLQAGSKGDRIRVRTVTSHRVLLATVAAPDLVEVGVR